MTRTKTTVAGNVNHNTITTVHLCVPDDQSRYLPRRRRAPTNLPPDVPLPRQGDVVFLSRSSAWTVHMVIHDWQAPDNLRVEVWLVHVGTGRPTLHGDFAVTQ